MKRSFLSVLLAPCLALAAQLPDVYEDCVGMMSFPILKGTNTLDLANFKDDALLNRFNSWRPEARTGDSCSWERKGESLTYSFDGENWRNNSGEVVNDKPIPAATARVIYIRLVDEETFLPASGHVHMEPFTYMQSRMNPAVGPSSNWQSFGGAHKGSRPDRKEVSVSVKIAKGDTVIKMPFTYGNLNDSPYFVNSRIEGVTFQPGDAISWIVDGKEVRWTYDQKDWISPENRHHAAFVIPIAAGEFTFHRTADVTHDAQISGYIKK